jgi:uncharacterized protein (TIGR03435 family)
MLKAIVPGGLAWFAICLSYGQTGDRNADKALTFDAASVKPATLPAPDGRGRVTMAGPSGGPGTNDPGRIRYPYMSLKNLLMNAYDVKSFQIQGPAWLDTERFDVNATMPPETTREQFRVMLQNLLAERFKLTLHRETRELPMYSLAVAKNGPKLKQSEPVSPARESADAAPPSPLGMQPKIGPDGFPVFQLPAGGRGGLFMMMMPGRARLVGQQQTMLDLANRLTTQLSRPVSDATGLTAKYDFTLTFSPEGMNAPTPQMGAGGVMVSVAPPSPSGAAAGAAPASPSEAETPPDIFRAVKDQLGLTLEPKKGPVELIVIDHIEKTPTEN